MIQRLMTYALPGIALQRSSPLRRLVHTNRPEHKARIVMNHSTHAPGVLEALDAIAHEPCITTLVPSRLSGGTKGTAEHLSIRVTTETQQGFKLIARKGTFAQEIFAVCVPGTTSESLQKAIDARIPRRKRYKQRQAQPGPGHGRAGDADEG